MCPMLKFLLLIVANFAAIVGAMYVGDLRLNLSNSQPVGYLSANAVNCGGHTPVFKRVMAISGDQVEITDQVWINGDRVPNTELLPTDTLGREFYAATGGSVADGEVWLIGNEIKYSWDSRYFGPVDQHMIIAKVQPVWTF